MTKQQRQQSLTAARRACEWLDEYITQMRYAPYTEETRCLLAEFKRLDDKEQKQIKSGNKGAKYGKLGAIHGSKGGRPKKTNGGTK